MFYILQVQSDAYQPAGKDGTRQIQPAIGYAAKKSNHIHVFFYSIFEWAILQLLGNL